MLDTGALHSVINEDLFMQIPNTKIRNASKVLIGYGNSAITLLGECNIKVELPKKQE